MIQLNKIIFVAFLTFILSVESLIAQTGTVKVIKKDTTPIILGTWLFKSSKNNAFTNYESITFSFLDRDSANFKMDYTFDKSMLIQASGSYALNGFELTIFLAKNPNQPNIQTIKKYRIHQQNNFSITLYHYKTKDMIEFVRAKN